MKPEEDMIIRNARPADLDAITRLEAETFPKEQAASRLQFKKRLQKFPDHFWLLWIDDHLVSMVNGAVTKEKDLTDEMYEDASCHNPSGEWQMIFGVNTDPAYRHHGYASMLIKTAIHTARSEGRRGVVLTCLKDKIPFYERFGFQNEGISVSVHGGAVWYQMRLVF